MSLDPYNPNLFYPILIIFVLIGIILIWFSTKNQVEGETANDQAGDETAR